MHQEKLGNEKTYVRGTTVLERHRKSAEKILRSLLSQETGSQGSRQGKRAMKTDVRILCFLSKIFCKIAKKKRLFLKPNISYNKLQL